MKISKLIFIPLLAVLLASCSSSSIEGKYVFQMGKTQGTHFGIELLLTNEQVKKDETVLGKKMTLDFDLDMTTFSSTESNGVKSLASGVTKASNNSETEDLVDNSFGFDGYYVYDASNAKKDAEGNDLVGIGITQLFDIRYDEEGKRIKDAIPLDIPATVFDKVIYSTISGSTFTLVIPVSLDDLVFQLYWYGIDLLGKDTPTEHSVGSTPKQNEIDKINETYPDGHDGKLFRKFHQLHMGLTKN